MNISCIHSLNNTNNSLKELFQEGFQKNRSLSEESKQKIREARAKQVFSEESLAKRSESIKKF